LIIDRKRKLAPQIQNVTSNLAALLRLTDSSSTFQSIHSKSAGQSSQGHTETGLSLPLSNKPKLSQNRHGFNVQQEKPRDLFVIQEKAFEKSSPKPERLIGLGWAECDFAFEGNTHSCTACS